MVVIHSWKLILQSQAAIQLPPKEAGVFLPILDKIGWVAIQASEHAKSFEDYLHIAEICGYQYGWAVHRWQEHEDEISQIKNLQNARYSC